MFKISGLKLIAFSHYVIFVHINVSYYTNSIYRCLYVFFFLPKFVFNVVIHCIYVFNMVVMEKETSLKKKQIIK